MTVSLFALVWGKMLDSSVWELPPAVRCVWIAMLLMKDSNGIVRSSVAGLRRRANVELEDVEKALLAFEGEDPDSMTEANGGRRIEKVPGGWRILNHELYRFSDEARRAYWRELKAKQRAANAKKKGGGATAREREAARQFGDGNTEASEKMAEPASTPRGTVESDHSDQEQEQNDYPEEFR